MITWPKPTYTDASVAEGPYLSHQGLYYETLGHFVLHQLDVCLCDVPAERYVDHLLMVLRRIRDERERSRNIDERFLLHLLESRGLVEHGPRGLDAPWLTKAGQDVLSWLEEEAAPPTPAHS